MTTKLLFAFAMTAALAACGSKAKKSTTPSQTEMKANGSAMGGSTYGGTMTPAGGSAAPMPMGGGGADPCATTK